MDRDKVLGLFRAARAHLEDRRASHQVGPIGGIITITASTPQSLREEAESEEKAAFMAIIIDLLRLAPITQAYRDYILKVVGVQYNFGLPADQVLSPIGLVDRGEWKLFEGQPDHERGWLEAEAGSFFLQSMAAMFVGFPEDVEDQLTLEQTSEAFVQTFTGAPSQEDAWPDKDLFWEKLKEQLGPMGVGQWARIFERAGHIVAWIEQFRTHAKDPDAFNTVEPIFRRASKYKTISES